MAFDQSFPWSWANQKVYEAINGRYAGRKEWVQSLSDTGLKLDECATEAGIGTAQLARFARLYCVRFSGSPSRRIIRSAELNKILRMRQAENTIDEIAQELGIKSSTLSEIIRTRLPDAQKKAGRKPSLRQKPPKTATRKKRAPKRRKAQRKPKPAPPPAPPKTALERYFEMAARENALRQFSDRPY